MTSNEADKIADSASKAQSDFMNKHWAYFYSRERQHPITGEIPQRNRMLDKELTELSEANKKAQKQAEDIAYFERVQS